MPRKKTSRKQRGGRKYNTKNLNKTQKKQYGGNNTLLQKIETSIKEDDIDLFEDLLTQGINPNTVLLNGETILNTIIDSDYIWSLDFVKLLLSFNVRLDFTNNGDTPIIRAVKRLDPDLLFLLLRNGASLPKNRQNRQMLLDTIYRLEPPQSDRLNYFNWRDTFQVLYSQLKEDVRLENAQFNTNLTHRSHFTNDILRGISQNYEKKNSDDLSSDRINTHMGVYLDTIN